MNALALSFHETQFDVIDRLGQPWLKATEIAKALGYANDNAISRIYARNSDEFTDTMTEKVKLTLSGNLEKEVRIFSLRGCHLLAMFARTKVAKEFRKWVLDVLDSLGQVSTPQYGLKELPPGQPKKSTKYLPGCLTLEQQEAVRALVKTRAESIPSQPLWGPAAQRMWSSIKSKFGVGYKEVPAEHFTEVLSLVARVPLEGEHIPADTAHPEQTEIPFSPFIDGRLLLRIEAGKITDCRSIGPNEWVLSIEEFRELMAKEGHIVVDVHNEDALLEFFDKRVPDDLVIHVVVRGASRLAKLAATRH